MIRYKSPLEFKVISIYFCLEGQHWKSIRKQNEKSTVFPIIITHPQCLLNFEPFKVRRLLEGGAFFKVTEIIHMKFQTLSFSLPK